jgi:hypothetical protein
MSTNGVILATGGLITLVYAVGWRIVTRKLSLTGAPAAGTSITPLA